MKHTPQGVGARNGGCATVLGLVLVAATLGCSEPMTQLPAHWVEPTTGIELALIPSGTFVMGSPESELGREAQEVEHWVTISRPFYLGRTEVTQRQWLTLMGANPSQLQECGEDCPVEEISWQDAQRFVSRLSQLTGETFRLPTEAEWEYSCRAGTSTPFHWGDQLGTDRANYDADPPSPGFQPGLDRGTTLPVASFPPNAWGLYDMHGNVWEFCEDLHCPYPTTAATDPIGRCNSGLRVIRGGSWHYGADSARCALRYTHRPTDTGPSLGFRIVREVP